MQRKSAVISLIGLFVLTLGATVAARLMRGELDELRKEVDRIARSVVITKKIDGKK